MKIAVNTRFLLPKTHLEGIGRYSYEILQRLCLKHPEHTFYFFFDRPYHPRYLFAPNVVPVVLHPQARHPILFTLWFEWSVRRKMRELEVDVFLSFDGLSTLLGSTPEVLVIHDIVYAHEPSYLPWLIRWYLRTVMPRFIRKASQLVAVSQFVADDVRAHYHIQDEKIKVACNALPSSFAGSREKLPRPESNPYFIVPGAIIERKNTLNILRAFDIFCRKQTGNFKLVFAGRFMFKPTSEVQTLWNQMQQNGRLIHLNKPTDEEMVQWVQNAHALIYASLFEGFGIPILEGMASGVPVITSNVTSMPEVAGNAALCVDPQNPEAIAGAMEQLLDEKNRSLLIIKGKEQVKKFSWDQSAETIYESLVVAGTK